MPSGYKKDGSFAGKVFKKSDTPWNFGKKCPQLSGDNHHKYWLDKKFSEKHKIKISLGLKGNRSSLGRIGKNANHWKGGLSSEDYLERRKFQKTTQKLVFERDNYTCQLCEQKGGDLQVDHIQSWKEYVKLRFSMDNCRTLCSNCHYKITFGKPMPKNIKAWGHNIGRRILP